MLKWVLAISVIYMLYRMVMSEKAKKKEEEQEEKENLAATGELAKDPICGTYVDKEDAIRVKDGEAIHYFCGYDCRDKFINKKQIEPND